MATFSDLTELILHFRAERDWQKFNDPKECAIALIVEAAEVLEYMQWEQGQALTERATAKRTEIGHELADVLYWVLLLAHDLNIDLDTAFRSKMAENAAKYPVEKAKGSTKKYTEL